MCAPSPPPPTRQNSAVVWRVGEKNRPCSKFRLDSICLSRVGPKGPLYTSHFVCLTQWLSNVVAFKMYSWTNFTCILLFSLPGRLSKLDWLNKTNSCPSVTFTFRQYWQWCYRACSRENRMSCQEGGGYIFFIAWLPVFPFLADGTGLAAGSDTKFRNALIKTTRKDVLIVVCVFKSPLRSLSSDFVRQRKSIRKSRPAEDTGCIKKNPEKSHQTLTH